MKKRIIVCCDGTWNDLEMRYITNVGRLVQALLPAGNAPGGPIPQLVFYDDGVGADASGIKRLLQGAFGLGIDNLIYEAYRFVAMNYEPGDEICLFGFSRGAFTVRSVAGMIGRVGLVPRSELKHMPGAMTAYRSKNKSEQARFKQEANSLDVEIDLLACWDTVGALGIPDKIPLVPLDNIARKRFEFHDTNLGKHIKRALHAVAIDERRKEFEATLMHKPDGAPATLKLVQTWFPGDHGCVGGGSWEKRGLSNHCLKWMIDQAKLLGMDIGVDWHLLHDRAITDSSIFFSRKSHLFYGKRDRDMPRDVVTWDDIDNTARQRWVEHRDYRPPVLQKRFAAELNALPAGPARRPPGKATPLQVGESADVRVWSRTKDNPSHVVVEQGASYDIEVSRLQVWKDGDLDPCDILGWNTVKTGAGSNLPYQDGEQADYGALKSWLVQAAAGKKRAPTADWFELVLRVGEGGYIPLGIQKPSEETDPFKMTFTATGPGELFFAANDLASRFDIIDKYDNNTGWVWIRITRGR